MDVGGGHSLVSKAPNAAGTATPTSYTPPPVGPAGGVSSASPAPAEHAGRSHGPSFAATPIYVWMAALALFAGVVVSGSPFVARDGLHLHPIYGVAAGFALVGLYRYLMTWFPTAVLVTLASTCLWAALTWVSRHAAQLRDLPAESGQAFLNLTTLATRFEQSMRVAPDPWGVAVAATALILHVLYWRHRRAVVAENGWLFNRGIANAARTLGLLAATSVALGAVLAFLSRWSR